MFGQAIFLKHAAEDVRVRGYRIVNGDVTVVLEEPRLTPFRDRIRNSVATVLEIAVRRVSIKAKTAEGLGAVGEGRSTEAYAVAMIARSESSDE